MVWVYGKFLVGPKKCAAANIKTSGQMLYYAPERINVQIL